jgi:hypothetical protein
MQRARACRSGSGTVTHLAPELFQVGSKLTSAVDAFSFGIMMWVFGYFRLLSVTFGYFHDQLLLTSAVDAFSFGIMMWVFGYFRLLSVTFGYFRLLSVTFTTNSCSPPRSTRSRSAS